MSTEPLDIYEYRAALLAWHQENIGQTQRIYLAEDSQALLQEIRDDVRHHASSLTYLGVPGGSERTGCIFFSQLVEEHNQLFGFY